ncbi:MAG: hypothetical protein QGI50_15515 [Dehalococcoidia bacterium]|jgi:hypothetical protein|nr:hypothetical protein [Dehalococcoidia bacterium]
MFSIRGIKARLAALSIVGVVALCGIASSGMGVASADPLNLVVNGSFEAVSVVPILSYGMTPSYLPGWEHQARGTDSVYGVTTSPPWVTGPCDIEKPHLGTMYGCPADGKHALVMTASTPANKGWPGVETTDAISIDPQKEYMFQASYYTFGFSNQEEAGLPWMDITLFDADGKRIGAVSTGTSKIQEPSGPHVWHEKTYKFKPAVLAKYFGDIASVKLGLRQSLNYGFVGYEKGSETGVAYDNVRFYAVN